MRRGYPLALPGMRIGLLGGSFDPPHEGHVHISRWALARFGLDRVWWLLSPHNPLKPQGPAPLPARMAACRALIRDPRILPTDIETRLGTRYTADTLAHLLPLYPGVRFVWLMGADNLAEFDRWDRWRDIAAMVPIGVLARPHHRAAARSGRAARILARHRLPEWAAPCLPAHRPPVWAFVNLPMRDISSTALREAGLGLGGSEGEAGGR